MTTHLTERITVDPERCAGRPTIRGVWLQVGTVEELLEAFPTLEPADIPACLELAQQLIAQQFSRLAAWSMPAFLVDANLPYRFVYWRGEEFLHQRDLGERWQDTPIWAYPSSARLNQHNYSTGIVST